MKPRNVVTTLAVGLIGVAAFASRNTPEGHGSSSPESGCYVTVAADTLSRYDPEGLINNYGEGRPFGKIDMLPVISKKIGPSAGSDHSERATWYQIDGGRWVSGETEYSHAAVTCIEQPTPTPEAMP